MEGAEPFQISTYFYVGEKVKPYIQALWGTSEGPQMAEPFQISTYFYVGEKVKPYIQALWGTSEGPQMLAAGQQQGIVRGRSPLTELTCARRALCQLVLYTKKTKR